MDYFGRREIHAVSVTAPNLGKMAEIAQQVLKI
jgi:hypothetical protein